MREQALKFIEALGGPDNIVDVEGCVTRLRGTLVDPKKIDIGKLGRLGVIGRPMIMGKAVQIVVGTHAELIGSEMTRVLKERK